MKTPKQHLKPMPASDGAGLDWAKARHVEFPNLKLSTRSISLRLPESLLNKIKTEANRRDVPYQSYIKVLLAEAVKRAV